MAPILLCTHATPSADTFIEIISTQCLDITHCRTIWKIIWSCFGTIFAMTWIAIHCNVPDPRTSALRVTLHRVAITAFALLVPEFIVWWAVRQWLMAWGYIDENNKMAKAEKENEAVEENEKNVPTKETLDNSGSSGRKFVPYVNPITAYNFFPAWTMTHGFFAFMGGFYYVEGEVPIPPDDMAELVKSGSFKLPDRAEIDDKSKRDAFSKAVAISQTMWFVTQCIARAIQDLPLTELETLTLVYAAVNVSMYYFWWSKPLSVGRPVRVQRVVTQPDISRISPRTPCRRGTIDTVTEKVAFLRFVKAAVGVQGHSQQSQAANTIALSFAMLFGAVHCTAWSSTFPSPTEKLLWRISSVTLIATPAICIVFIMARQVFDQDGKTTKWFSRLSMIGIPVNYVARFTLLVLACTTLRSPSPTELETIDWLLFLPHL